MYGGGDGTTTIFDIKWDSWGEPTAIGHGKAVRRDLSPLDAPDDPCVVVAWDLGYYKGIWMYRKYDWIFPSLGEKLPKASDPGWWSWPPPQF